MKNEALSFDRNKHLLYSKGVVRILRAHLQQQYPAQAEALWETLQLQYVQFLETVPYLGGKQNKQASGVYDCIALFAYYEILPEKPTLEAFAAVSDEYFHTPAFLGHLVSLNWKPILRLGNLAASRVAQNNRAHAADWPGQYLMTVLPFEPSQGIRFRFDRCPIAEFAKAHGYTELMPAMCNPDYPMMDTLHGYLIRTTTCANGNCCDYQIVGNQSEAAKAHPRKQRADGYWFNP